MNSSRLGHNHNTNRLHVFKFLKQVKTSNPFFSPHIYTSSFSFDKFTAHFPSDAHIGFCHYILVCPGLSGAVVPPSSAFPATFARFLHSQITQLHQRKVCKALHSQILVTNIGKHYKSFQSKREPEIL